MVSGLTYSSPTLESTSDRPRPDVGNFLSPVKELPTSGRLTFMLVTFYLDSKISQHLAAVVNVRVSALCPRPQTEVGTFPLFRFILLYMFATFQACRLII